MVLKKAVQYGIGAVGVLAALALAGCGPGEPVTKGGPVEMRRLTEDQYRSIITDVFGPTVSIASRFDPLIRTEGLLAVGASNVDFTPASFERYESLGRSIAVQVVDAGHRDTLVPCKPASVTEADAACAKQFFTGIGRLLYRRPLTDKEVQRQVDIAGTATKTFGDFYAGLASSLTGMLAAPNFLYIVDMAQPDPGKAGAMRLTNYSKASRLSFLLWNTSPDDILLKAAESGKLETEKGLDRQVERLVSSPRLKNGVRAFFSDMLAFDDFGTLAKDGVIYPAFNSAVAKDAKEQTLRTIADLLVTQKGDYRDLFTTRQTFISGPLGVVYRVPAAVPGGGWVKYEFPEGDPRVGILSQLSFVALHSHPGKSSATLRGKALRELVMCQKVPDPPAAVSFELFNDPNSPIKTARERLQVHSTNPACAGCHKIMDPIGLTMETFDGAGQLRTAENGAPIDVSGEIDGVTFQGTAGLGKVLHDNPATAACLVNRLYAYSTGRVPTNDEREWMNYLQERFVADGYRVPELMKRIARSNAFYAVAPPRGDASPVKSAAGTTVSGKEIKS